MSLTDAVLEVKDLRTYFVGPERPGKAVDGVSFILRRGRTLGLVGESGSGKSLTALSILGLQPPSARVVSGSVLFEGVDLLTISPREMVDYRGKKIALILQDPMSALDPLFTVGDQIMETVRFHERTRGRQLRDRAVELLRLLKVSAPEDRVEAYPHQLSGGMRQRAVGAIALSCSPTVLIADEPTTSLDVTVQAAYLSLLRDIQQKTDLAILFVTHDFGVVARICDEVAVMYAGRIVETAPTQVLFERPAHPYSEALLASVPDVGVESARLTSIPGSPPQIDQIPDGCPFAARCSYVMERCRSEYPPPVMVADGQTVRCWRHT